jgi:hypothetical protein
VADDTCPACGSLSQCVRGLEPRDFLNEPCSDSWHDGPCQTCADFDALLAARRAAQQEEA